LLLSSGATLYVQTDDDMSSSVYLTYSFRNPP